MMREKILGVSEGGEVQRRQRVTQLVLSDRLQILYGSSCRAGAQFFRGTVQIDQNCVEGQRLTSVIIGGEQHCMLNKHLISLTSFSIGLFV